MSARDELMGIVYRGNYNNPASPFIQPLLERSQDEIDRTRKTADAILAAGYSKPRTITTAEELDGLADGSAILDGAGDVLTKHAHWWHSYETAPLMSRKVAKYSPITVLYEP